MAHEVVSCMIPKSGESGLLLILEKEIKEIKQVEEYRKSNFTASFSNSLQNTQRVFNENPPRSPHVFGGSFIKSKEPLQV